MRFHPNKQQHPKSIDVVRLKDGKAVEDWHLVPEKNDSNDG